MRAEGRFSVTRADWDQLLEQENFSSNGGGALFRASSPATHVAVDRFTAAPAEGKLFSALAFDRMEFEPICIDLALDRFETACGNNANAALALLLCVFNEMFLEAVPLGYGATRGHGWIALDKIEFRLDGSVPEALPGVAELVELGKVVRAAADATYMAEKMPTILRDWNVYLDQGEVAHET
ncbi:hypothetical protein FF124_13010 [Martelella lutilitoris]|uniref:Uncharacterized protein n=1 Tax=Martelella lutilitoris TaxID=2583532 RepID=A0A5C4JP33_9HYPH|nr:hypothetical protein [Martelella lutilitoris]TNB47098.1 hypothetical protein FF124_13010 [Martelella lutilitoris]